MWNDTMRYQKIIFSLLFIFSVSRAQNPSCESNENSTRCEYLELKADKPIEVDVSRPEAYLIFTNGSIGAKTLAPFKDARLLMIYSTQISHVEDGALCSLPNLRELIITNNPGFPTLTKGILKGCDKIEKFNTDAQVEEDSLHEMINVKDLQLTGPVTAKFNKAYLAPLKKLKSLLVETGDLEKVEPGLFCSSPELEKLHIYIRSPLPITKDLFQGCTNVKDIYIPAASQATIGEGVNPFSNLPKLEKLLLHEVVIDHLTKDLLTGFPNLKSLALVACGITKIDNDAFANLPKLEDLELSGTPLEEQHLQILQNIKSLVKLNLASDNLKSIDVLKGLSNLEHLDLTFNTVVKFDLNDLKKSLPKLKVLDVKGNPTDPEFEKQLAEESTIKVIYGPYEIDPGYIVSFENAGVIYQ